MTTEYRVIHEVIIKNVPYVDNVRENLKDRLEDLASEEVLSPIESIHTVHQGNKTGHAFMTFANQRDNEIPVNEWVNKVFRKHLLQFEAHRWTFIRFTRDELRAIVDDDEDWVEAHQSNPANQTDQASRQETRFETDSKQEHKKENEEP